MYNFFNISHEHYWIINSFGILLANLFLKASCIEIGDFYYVKSNTYYKCSEDPWLSWNHTFATPLILLYLIILPSIYIIILYKRKNTLFFSGPIRE